MNQMERKEPTLSNFTPDRDEIAAQQQRMGGARPAAPRQTQARGGGSALGVFALLVALAAVGGSGYLAWQLQLSQQELVKADKRLLELEKQLALSDDESSQSVTALQAKLKWADAEIRKLWGVSHDTNRKAIKANGAQLASLKKSVQKDLAKAKQQAAAAQKLAEGQQKSLANTGQETSNNALRLEQLAETLDEQRQSLQAAVDKANRAEQQVARLKTDVSARLRTNEEAIEAIDAFRRSGNRDIIDLKRRATSGQGPAG